MQITIDPLSNCGEQKNNGNSNGEKIPVILRTTDGEVFRLDLPCFEETSAPYYRSGNDNDDFDFIGSLEVEDFK